MLADHPVQGIEALVQSGLADIVLPEVPALQLEIDEHHRHKDVFEHTLMVVDRAIALETGPDGPVPAPDLTLRLAALLHDIGKPATRRFEPGGKVSFHHHDAVGARLARKRLKALRFDHHLIADVCDLISMHLRFHGYVDERWTDAAVRRYARETGPLYERLNRLTRADATTRNKRKAQVFSSAMDVAPAGGFGCHPARLGWATDHADSGPQARAAGGTCLPAHAGLSPGSGPCRPADSRAGAAGLVAKRRRRPSLTQVKPFLDALVRRLRKLVTVIVVASC